MTEGPEQVEELVQRLLTADGLRAGLGAETGVHMLVVVAGAAIGGAEGSGLTMVTGAGGRRTYRTAHASGFLVGQVDRLQYATGEAPACRRSAAPRRCGSTTCTWSSAGRSSPPAGCVRGCSAPCPRQ